MNIKILLKFLPFVSSYVDNIMGTGIAVDESINVYKVNVTNY
jgi:hypothetical protein